MNFKDTMNCISSNDRLIDGVLKQKKYSTIFYAKGKNLLTNGRITTMLHSKTH